MKPTANVTLQNPAVVWATKGKLLATSLLCLIMAAPSGATAASANVPTVDIATTCRTSEKAVTSIFGPGNLATFDSCMKQENDARAEIIKNWRSYPAGGRQRCINTTGYMPSYVEWLTCLEMEQAVEAMRKNNPAMTNPAATYPATTEGRGKR